MNTRHIEFQQPPAETFEKSIQHILALPVLCGVNLPVISLTLDWCSEAHVDFCLRGSSIFCRASVADTEDGIVVILHARHNQDPHKDKGASLAIARRVLTEAYALLVTRSHLRRIMLGRKHFAYELEQL